MRSFYVGGVSWSDLRRNYDCPIGEGPCSTQNGDGYCTGVEANGCIQDTDCNTGACLAGACVAKESVPKGGFCDSDAECASSAICNLKEGVDRCDSRLPRGIKLSYCDNDSQRNQNGVKWSVCSPAAKRCETPVGLRQPQLQCIQEEV